MSTISMDCTHQYLIDARLDAIERILMDSRVSRGERSEIVQAVENQIFEMLEAEGGEPTRDRVLRVLRSLDPPEAYCSETLHEPFALSERTRFDRSAVRDMHANQSMHHTQAKTSAMAVTALVLALLSIPAIIIVPVAAMFGLAGAVCGVIAIHHTAASNGQLRGMWMGIFGCVLFALHYLAVWYILMLQ